MEFCCYCGKILTWPLKRTMEHLVPVSKRGSNSLTNKKPCCERCNKWRGNRKLTDWKIEIESLLLQKRCIKGYILYDYEIMIENIDYWQHYIDTSKSRLIK